MAHNTDHISKTLDVREEVTQQTVGRGSRILTVATQL